jgi:hypothetical protein
MKQQIADYGLNDQRHDRTRLTEFVTTAYLYGTL